MKVIIFGTGKLYERNKAKFSNMEILCFLDNNSQKQGTYVDGIEVVSPNCIFKYQYEYILLVSKFYQQMREQLVNLGVPESRILDRYHTTIYGMREITRFEGPQVLNGNKKVCLVSHDLSLSGAPIVLFDMAEILLKNNYQVEVYVPNRGKLLYKYLEKGIPITIFQNFEFGKEEIEKYFSKFDIVVVNTVTLFGLVSRLQSLNKRVIWWLHEEENIYKELAITEKNLKITQNTQVYGVGKRAIDTFVRYSCNEDIKEFRYGIEENKQYPIRSKEKIIFAIIGGVCERKAQDVFVKTIIQNQENWFKLAEFWIIGNISEELHKRYEMAGLIKVWGLLEHEKMLEIYKEIDVVVCPSRNDPLPVVVTEGMMNEKVCIVSDMTGSADYITPYENGLICKAADVESLANCISWVLNNKEKIKTIGFNAYQTYKKYFSMEQFEKKLLKIIEEL